MRSVSELGRCAVASTILLLAASVAPAAAQQQQTLNDVLSFLLTNQSVRTGDPAQDQLAAAATRDTISRALLVDIATMPLGSSSGGFAYQFSPTLGTLQRRSTTFGPYFVERVLGAGANRFSLGLSAQYARFDTLDGNNLRNGQFITTSNQFRDEGQAFDIDALTLRLQTSVLTASTRYGITDRLEIGADVPLVSLTLNGQRVNSYRGSSFLQAVASASRTGLGDIAVRTKYRALGNGASGLAIAGDVRLPTGRSEDLLGAGRMSVGVLVVGSLESGAFAVHVNAGYAIGGISDELRFGGAAAVAVTPHLTIDGELLGRRLVDVGRIAQVAFSNPTIAGVETYRLLPVGGSTLPVLVATGIKWNVAETWVVDAHLVLPLDDSGLTARFTPTIAVERTFGR